jgi:ABC-type Fe3+ transport system substrate-binding protein
VDAVSRGSAAVGFASEGVAAEAFASGAPVRWTVPNPAIVGEGPQAVVENAPHPNAARLFQEFTLSELGQAIWSNDALFASRREGFTINPDVVEGQNWWQPFEARVPYGLDQDAEDAAADDIVAKFQDFIGQQ